MFLSAGHDNKDPGAVGIDGRKEADIAVEFRNIVSFYLGQMKIKHVVDGLDKQNSPLSAAIKEARKHHDAALEFHCNAHDNPKATGVEILCQANDKPMATQICAALAEIFGIVNRGVKPENAGQHHRLGFVQAGGMIVELFFITNAKDLAAYDAKKWVAGRRVAEILASVKI